MTLSELIEQLEALQDEYGTDLQVRIATQPSWPLSAHLTAINVTELELSDESVIDVVWLAASTGVGHGESPYAPKEAWFGAEHE